MATEVLYGHIVRVEKEVWGPSLHYFAEFRMADSTLVECTWTADDRIDPGAQVKLEVIAGASKPGRVTDTASGNAWDVSSWSAKPLAETLARKLVITDAMEEDLRTRAAVVGVSADIVYDDMGRPVLIVGTGRGPIKRGISGLENWEALLDSVGLGSTV